MPAFEIYVATRRVVRVGLFTQKVRHVPAVYVLGTLHAASPLHAVGGYWNSGVRKEYPSLLSHDGEPIAKSRLRRRMIKARGIAALKLQAPISKHHGS